MVAVSGSMGWDDPIEETGGKIEFGNRAGEYPGYELPGWNVCTFASWGDSGASFTSSGVGCASGLGFNGIILLGSCVGAGRVGVWGWRPAVREGERAAGMRRRSPKKERR